MGLPHTLQYSTTSEVSFPTVAVPALKHPWFPPHLRVQKACHHWASLNDPYITKVVSEGLKLDWIEGFTPENPEIPWKDVKCCSSIFAIPKKDSPHWRLITNLSNVNAFLQTTYFTLPTWKDIFPFLQKGMWACKVDIKGAYNHWPLHPRDKPYLTFSLDGKVYQHERLLIWP